jgi:RNA polymerase sigma factor (TIGR02999 family)
MSRSLAELVTAAEQGDPTSRDALFAELYTELRRTARRELGRPGAPSSVGVTTLLHEAYVAMAGRDADSFPDRPRFMGYAARVMRGLVIDHVRRHRALKRGGLFEITALDTDVAETVADADRLTSLGAALDTLEERDPLLAHIVDLKFFCGLSFAEIAALQNQSERTVQRRWEKARLYLHHALGGDSSPI